MYASSAQHVLHELGHQFDYQVMSDFQRDWFRMFIGDPRPWRSSPNSPHEQFAEAYRTCAMLRTRSAWEFARGGGFNYDPPWRRHRRICLMIKRAGQ